MRSFIAALSTAVLAPILGLAAPAGHDGLIARGENLCSLKAPPALCEPDASVTAEETAERAYKFYKAFVVDGDPAAMFSYIDSSYIVSQFPMILALLYGTSARTLTVTQIIATPPRLRKRSCCHLAPFLQRQPCRIRGQQRVVLRCQHQHVLRTILHGRPMAMGGRLRPRARKYRKWPWVAFV